MTMELCVAADNVPGGWLRLHCERGAARDLHAGRGSLKLCCLFVGSRCGGTSVVRLALAVTQHNRGLSTYENSTLAVSLTPRLQRDCPPRCPPMRPSGLDAFELGTEQFFCKSS